LFDIFSLVDELTHKLPFFRLSDLTSFLLLMHSDFTTTGTEVNILFTSHKDTYVDRH